MTDEREERIRQRAYEMWQRDGSPDGQHDAHWHEAAAQVDAEMKREAEGSADSQKSAESAPAKPRARKSTAPKTTKAKAPASAAKAAPNSATTRKPRTKKAAKPGGET